MINEAPSFVELSPSSKARKYSEDERKIHCEAWQKSGLSMTEYCRQSGLAVSTLSKWLNQSSYQRVNKPQGNLSPLITESSALIEIILLSGLRLKYSKGTISEVLRLIKALESCH